MPRARTSGTGAPKARPTSTAHVPETAIAAIVVVVRPTRSATAPATTHPTAPAATTTKAARLASAGSVTPAAARLATKNSGTHVHIANSSHMWPR